MGRGGEFRDLGRFHAMARPSPLHGHAHAHLCSDILLPTRWLRWSGPARGHAIHEGPQVGPACPRASLTPLNACWRGRAIMWWRGRSDGESRGGGFRCRARFHSRPLSSHALMLARLRTDVLCHAHAGAFAGCHGGRIRVTAASKKFTFSRRNTRPHAVGRAFRDGDMQHALHVQEVRLLPGMCYDFMWFHSMSKRPPQPRSGVGHGWVQ
jgi:hypothetical protein